ncbi:type III secretion protein [Pseudomonas aeruginosa]|nr:type III secretion protein [Pseudomonas aeruginosa]
MDWVELAVAQFCQDLRVSVPAPLARVVQLDFEDSGTLQLERHGEQLSLWLACDLAWHQAYRGTLRALRLCHARAAGSLPLRCAWSGESRLLLCITLEARQVGIPTLHQALQALRLGAQRSARRMSRVGAWHIGIERLDLAHAEPFAPPLPERHLLAPDGRPVETHVASLYPAQQAQQRLFDYARPQLEFHGLLRPGDFRQALRDLRLALTLPRQPALQAAACLLGERDEDERLLQMALNLLHKV